MVHMLSQLGAMQKMSCHQETQLCYSLPSSKIYKLLISVITVDSLKFVSFVSLKKRLILGTVRVQQKFFPLL